MSPVSDVEMMHKRKKKKKKEKKCTQKNTHIRGTPTCIQNKQKRLDLDDALKSANDFTGWSDARIRAWKTINTNLNAYLYRFNMPGEAQTQGKWSEWEHKLFMERLKTFGANDKWGEFSRVIPGRVGYQCSNYYRCAIRAQVQNI